MVPKSGIWLFLFWMNMIVHLVGIVIQSQQIIFFSKPLIMLLLLGWFLSGIRLKITGFAGAICLAFLFSLCGDVALMLQNLPEYQAYPMFLFGLGSFLLAHLCYVMAFFLYPSKEKGFLLKRPVMVLPFLVFWVYINYFLWNDLLNFRIPVVVYSAVINLMAIACLNASTQLPPLAFRRIFIGVCLFLCSDTLIALNRFSTKIEVPDSAFWIMLTYILAQYFIAHGAILANQRHSKSVRR